MCLGGGTLEWEAGRRSLFWSRLEGTKVARFD